MRVIAKIVFWSLLAFPGTGFAEPKSEASAVPIDATGLQSVLREHRGRVLVVNVWATWCAPCLREIPDLLTLQGEYSARGVVVLGVAVDEPTPGAAGVEVFRNRYFPGFLSYARQGSEIDELPRVIDPAWNEVVPTTYIIDREGRLRQRIQGKKPLHEFRLAVERVL